MPIELLFTPPLVITLPALILLVTGAGILATNIFWVGFLIQDELLKKRIYAGHRTLPHNCTPVLSLTLAARMHHYGIDPKKNTRAVLDALDAALENLAADLKESN